MKKLLSLVLASTMTLSLAACGNSNNAPANNNGESQTSNNSYTTDELVVNIWDNNQLSGIQQIADEWSAKSGVNVQINVINWDEYWTLLEAGAMGGEMADVFWMHINEAQKYMSNEVLLNLDDYIAADEKIDLNNYYEGIVDIYSYNGSQYALPKDHDTIALLYNKSIFDKYFVQCLKKRKKF